MRCSLPSRARPRAAHTQSPPSRSTDHDGLPRGDSDRLHSRIISFLDDRPRDLAFPRLNASASGSSCSAARCLLSFVGDGLTAPARAAVAGSRTRPSPNALHPGTPPTLESLRARHRLRDDADGDHLIATIARMRAPGMTSPDAGTVVTMLTVSAMTLLILRRCPATRSCCSWTGSSGPLLRHTAAAPHHLAALLLVLRSPEVTS